LIKANFQGFKSSMRMYLWLVNYDMIV